MDSLPNRIAQKRKLKGFTQEQLAEKLGKSSKQVISNWEKGRAEPSLADLRLLADVLGTTTSYLLEGDHR
jgi:transcriptional regulator with XRE-family HTH domain